MPLILLEPGVLLRSPNGLAADCDCECIPCLDFASCYDPCGPLVFASMSGWQDGGPIDLGIYSKTCYYSNLNREYNLDPVCEGTYCSGFSGGGLTAQFAGSEVFGEVGNYADPGLLYEIYEYDDNPQIIDEWYVTGVTFGYLCVLTAVQLQWVLICLQRFTGSDPDPPLAVDWCGSPNGCLMSAVLLISESQTGGRPQGCLFQNQTAEMTGFNCDGSARTIVVHSQSAPWI